MATRIPLGELLIQQNLVNQDTITDALRVQVGGNRRLGKILVRMGALSEDQLVEVLAKQLDSEPTDIQKHFSADVKKKLPRYLCKKYDVIPLQLKKNNILEIAMSDPSDHQAIHDLEQYTGNVIEARLARQSDIAAWTGKNIPYSMQDFFSPQASARFTRVAVALCLVLIVAVWGFSYRYIQTAKYGTVTKSADTTMYKNHDLMLGFDNKGTINFLGRGAYAKGYYSASFTNTNLLDAFIVSRKADFSEKEKEWLDWVINKTGPHGTPQNITSAR
jgi:hypothetical protein